MVFVQCGSVAVCLDDRFASVFLHASVAREGSELSRVADHDSVAAASSSAHLLRAVHAGGV